MMTKKNVLALLFLIIGMVSFAQDAEESGDAAGLSPESIPNPTVAGTGYVTSIGGYLSDAEIGQINEIITGIEKDTTVEIAVVVVPSLQDDIFWTAQALFDDWKIGKEDKNNGLLILAAIDDHDFRTQTGYGMEGVFTDAIISWMQESIVIPEFKNGKYGTGIINYLSKIGTVLREPDTLAEVQSNAAAHERSVEIEDAAIPLAASAIAGLAMLVAAVILFVAETKVVRRNARKKYTSYGKITALEGKGVGKRGYASPIALFPLGAVFLSIALGVTGIGGLLWFVGFGILAPAAGLFASIAGAVKSRTIKRDILRHWRNDSRPCTECGTMMEKLSETDDDKYLAPFQISEEHIGSEDYDVWLCPSCKNTTVEKFRAGKYSLYTTCPKCSGLTAHQTKREIAKLPTYTSSGETRIHFECLSCAHTFIVSLDIPVLTRSSSSSSSSFGSSSGGSSFGGGSSGGGGSSSHW